MMVGPMAGWGDCENSEIILNDPLMIAEISPRLEDHNVDKGGLSETLSALADEAARHFEKVLEEVAGCYEHTIAVTHVPPSGKAAWFRCKTSSDDFVPYFACKVIGDVLTRIMQAHRQSKLTVLCGHTRGGGEIQVLDNLRVLTVEGRYRQPPLDRILEFE